jgi:hypothetical protein
MANTLQDVLFSVRTALDDWGLADFASVELIDWVNQSQEELIHQLPPDCFPTLTASQAVSITGTEVNVPIDMHRLVYMNIGSARAMFIKPSQVAMVLNMPSRYSTAGAERPLAWFEGNTVIPIPATAITGTPGASGNVDIGSHYYTVTYLTKAGETLMGAISAEVVISASAKIVALTAIPVSPFPAVYARRLWRTKIAGGHASASDFWLLATISDNTSTTYSDNTAESGLTSTQPGMTNTAGAGGVIRINPSVTGITVTIQYLKVPSRVAADADTFGIVEERHSLLVDLTLIKALTSRSKDPSPVMARFKNNLELTIKSMAGKQQIV